MVIFKNNEMDRKSFNSLRYLTTVRPHHITRDPWIVDPFVYNAVSDLYGTDPIDLLGEYTRSHYTLEGHYYNLWNFDRKIEPKPSDPLIDRAIEHVAQLYRLPKKVDTYSWHSLANIPFIANSSAGWGFTGKKGDPGNHEKAIHRAVGNLNTWLENPKGFRFQPDLAWTRSQLCTFDNLKLRHVWGTSFDNIILEGITASPLIEAYRLGNAPIVIGDQLYKRLPDLIADALFDPDEQTIMYGVGLDISKFDSSVQPWLIDASFNILEQNLNFTGYMEYASWCYTKYFFKHRPIVMPDGRMWLKHLGVPSGSFYTQLIDSVANSVVCAYAQLKLYARTFKTKVLGDDSLFGIPYQYGYPDLSRIAVPIKTVGMDLSIQKSIVAQRPDELKFLGHVARNSKIDRDTAEGLRLALYPDREVQDAATSCARIAGLTLNSALNSWPMLHLYRYMTSRYRQQFTEHTPLWTANDKDWLVAVIGIPIQPTELNEVKLFSYT